MPASLKHSDKLRAWWWHRQGLDSATKFSSAAAVLQKTGWARSVGGCGPYLTLYSRAGISREAADQAVANLEIHELPSARGCTYVVPAADYGLALSLAQNSGAGEMRVAEKLGVTRKEIDKLRQAVIKALEKESLDPDGIRQAVGQAVRSLGPEGQQKGLSSTLPVALGELQTAGHIRRIPINGRLDQQRYQYSLWRPNPLQGSPLTVESSTAELARRFFTWIAPSSLSDFQTFAGVSARAAKTAVEHLKLERLSDDNDLLMLPSLRDEFESYKPPKEASYQLITGLDSLFLLRSDITSLVDAADLKNPLLSLKDGMLTGLSSPAIVDRGRIIGLWEYDPVAQSIAYSTFVKKDALLKRAIATTEAYVRTQLGDLRTFSLDSPKSRVPRIEALRNAN